MMGKDLSASPLLTPSGMWVLLTRPLLPLCWFLLCSPNICCHLYFLIWIESVLFFGMVEVRDLTFFFSLPKDPVTLKSFIEWFIHSSLI